MENAAETLNGNLKLLLKSHCKTFRPFIKPTSNSLSDKKLIKLSNNQHHTAARLLKRRVSVSIGGPYLAFAMTENIR